MCAVSVSRDGIVAVVVACECCCWCVCVCVCGWVVIAAAVAVCSRWHCMQKEASCCEILIAMFD